MVFLGGGCVFENQFMKPILFEFPSLWGLSVSRSSFQAQGTGQTYFYVWVLRSAFEFHTYFLHQYAPRTTKSAARFCSSAEENGEED